MSRVCNILRQQHAELSMLAREITGLVDGSLGVPDWTRVRLKLATWVRKLRVHLTLEERIVFARLVREPDPLVVRNVTRHQEELGKLRDGLARFSADRLASELSGATGGLAVIEEAKRAFAEVASMSRLEEVEFYGAVLSTASGHWAIADIADDGEDVDGSNTS